MKVGENALCFRCGGNREEGCKIRYCAGCLKKVNVERSQRHRLKYHSEILEKERIGRSKTRKPCRRCGGKIPHGVFGRKYCDNCPRPTEKEYRNSWRSRNKERWKEIQKNNQLKRGKQIPQSQLKIQKPESYRKRIASQKRFWEKNKENINAKTCVRNTKRKLKSFGMTLEDFSQVLGMQMGLCDICKSPLSMIGRKPDRAHLDHNHKTGKFRAIICMNCNVSMGIVKENIKTLESMIDYLKRHETIL